MKHLTKTMVVMMAIVFTMAFSSLANENDNVAYASSIGTSMTISTNVDGSSYVQELPDTQDDKKKDAAVGAFLMMNEIRKANGLNMLSWNDDLGPATLTRAQEATILWSHTRPDGSDWYTVNPSLCYGENLASGYTTVKNAVNAWMASPEHKANILSSEFTSGNIQIVENSDGTWYWAEEFC